MSNIIELLADIQRRLKVPKNQFSKFGNFKYRSCEDITESLKPILADLNAAITLTDQILLIGDRYYVQATATLFSGDNKIFAQAQVRESAEKKGMDAAQITGAAISYARKYALGGLFALDDTKDMDSSSYSNNYSNGNATNVSNLQSLKNLKMKIKKIMGEKGVALNKCTSIIQSILNKPTIDNIDEGCKVLKAIEDEAKFKSLIALI